MVGRDRRGLGVGRDRRGLGVILALTMIVLSGCTFRRAEPSATASAASPDNVIDFAGLPGITIGATLTDLTRAGAVTTSGPGCGPSFVSIPQASPVFDADTLVLIWAYPPLHTPENVHVGTSVEDAHRAFPSAVELSPPAGSHQYQGLLVTGPDGLAYLLLHDGSQVQKLIVGAEKFARMLFDTGYGAC